MSEKSESQFAGPNHCVLSRRSRQGLEVDGEPDPLSSTYPKTAKDHGAPFQLRVRTVYPRTQPVPSTPLSIRLGPPAASDVHPGEIRTQHVGSTRQPLSPELRTTTPPHGTPGTQRAGFTHLPGEVHLHSLGSLFILVLGHSLMSRRTHRSSPWRNVDVKVCSRQPDQPIILIGLPWRPAPDRALHHIWSPCTKIERD